jgi:hypothetical protein
MGPEPSGTVSGVSRPTRLASDSACDFGNRRALMPRMGPLNLTALWLSPLLAAFILLLMSVDNPFSIAFSAVLLTSQVPLIRWILALDGRQPVHIRIRR